MFGVTYKMPDGSFVSDEAKEKNVSTILKLSYFISHLNTILIVLI
jgi:hypothetical protein